MEPPPTYSSPNKQSSGPSQPPTTPTCSILSSPTFFSPVAPSYPTTLNFSLLSSLFVILSLPFFVWFSFSSARCSTTV